MASDPAASDDALHWDGDDDQALTPPPGWEARTRANTRGAGASRGGASADVSDATADDAGGEDVAVVEPGDAAASDAVDDEDDDGPRPLGGAALVTMGALGGIYLLYAIGWGVGAARLQSRALWLLGDVMFQGSIWLAVAAPVLWFAAVLLLARRRPVWVRLCWLIAGALLLIPWPFAMTGVTL